jgi:hypothetical protein
VAKKMGSAAIFFATCALLGAGFMRFSAGIARFFSRFCHLEKGRQIRVDDFAIGVV